MKLRCERRPAKGITSFSNSPFWIKDFKKEQFLSPYEHQHRIAPGRESSLQAWQGLLKKGAHRELAAISGIVSQIDKESGKVLGATSFGIACLAKEMEDRSRMEGTVC